MEEIYVEGTHTEIIDRKRDLAGHKLASDSQFLQPSKFINYSHRETFRDMEIESFAVSRRMDLHNREALKKMSRVEEIELTKCSFANTCSE